MGQPSRRIVPWQAEKARSKNACSGPETLQGRVFRLYRSFLDRNRARGLPGSARPEALERRRHGAWVHFLFRDSAEWPETA